MTTTFLKVKNNAESSLDASILSGATSLTLVAGGATFFPVTFPFHISIDLEIFRVTAAVGDTFTVVSAQEGTSAAGHAAGAKVELLITAQQMSDIHTAVNALEDTPSYIVVGLTSVLASERVLIAGSGLDSADGGAGGAFTLSVEDPLLRTEFQAGDTSFRLFKSGSNPVIQFDTNDTFEYSRAGNFLTLTINSVGTYRVSETLFSIFTNVDVGDHYIDITEIATPANPAADTRRLYVDSVSGELSVRTSAGTSISLEGDAPSDAEYLVLSLHGMLTMERVFTVGHGLDGTDAGAGSTFTLDVDETELDHGLLGGLTDDDHVGYLRLAGRAGGQTANGGTAAGEDLTLISTAHATKGSVFLGSSSLFEFAETTGQLKLPTSGSGAGLLLGTDVQVYRSAANTLRLDSGVSNSYMTLGNGRQIFGSAVDEIQFLATTVEFLAVADLNVLTFQPAALEVYLPELTLVHDGATFTSAARLIRIDSTITLNFGSASLNAVNMEGEVIYQQNGYAFGSITLFANNLSISNDPAASVTTFGLQFTMVANPTWTVDTDTVGFTTTTFMSLGTINTLNGGVATCTDWADFFSWGPTVNSGATISGTRWGLLVRDAPAGAGTIVNQVAVDINALTRASTLNIGLRNASRTVYTPSTVQTLAAGTALLANATVVQIQSTGAVTSTAAPFIADGQNGQIVIIINVDTTDAFTISDQGTLAGSNLRLSAATIALGPRDSITLMYNTTIGDWVQIAQVNVI